MSHSDLELIRHMVIETSFVVTHASGRTKEELVNDEVLCRAVVRSIEIIGEAAKKVQLEFKAAHPHIEWKKMAATRDVLIHDYFGVDRDILWDIVVNKIPELNGFLEDILDSSPEEGQ